jgi:hypothetical protein
MSTQLITNYFRLHNVKQFQESVSETANSVYYVFAGQHTTYPSGDSNIPNVTNTVDNTLYNAYQEMVFGKRVTPSDIVVMAKRYDWVANTKYIAYRSSQDLSDQPYYVGVNSGGSYSVFKCLDNNGNAYSTVPPDVTQTAPNDEYYSTSDGYVWKYMYSVDTTTFTKFATNLYIPVIANGQVTGNAVSGAIDIITIDYKGSNYNTFLSNTFMSTDLRIGGDPLKYNIANNAYSSNNFYIGSFMYLTGGTGYGQGSKIVDYVVVGTTKTVTLAEAFPIAPDVSTSYEITPYVYIVGDGDNAVGRAKVDTSQANCISGIEIINRGFNYTYATAVVLGNTGGVSNTAVLSVIKGPKNGHGYDPEYELNGSALGISVTFANTETGTIPVSNDYRSVGVLKDPLFSTVTITVSAVTGGFAVGETVTQANTGAQGIVTAWDSINQLELISVNGIILTGNSTVNYLTGSTTGSRSSVISYQVNGQTKNFNTFDQRTRFSFSPLYGTFTTDEQVYQTDVQFANGIFHSNTASNVYITHIQGTLNTGNTLTGQLSGATANLLYAFPPDLVVGSGQVLYYENESPITRSASQSETVKIILQF